MDFRRLIKSFLGWIRCRVVGIQSGKDVYFGSRVHVVNGPSIRIGDSVQIRSDCDLFARKDGIFSIGQRSDIGERNRICGNVVIGDSVLLGPGSYISSETHCYEDISRPIIDQGGCDVQKNGHHELMIGDGSWIGAHCAILGDVHIGEHCVIGANSVVTRDIPSFSVAVGSPAQVVKYFSKSIGGWVRNR